MHHKARRAIKGANIYLTGMMGSGKTTLGRLLSQKLGCPFADTDELIEARTNCSIAQLFREQGEAHFRDLETATLLELNQKRGWVVSLGGGAVLREVNRHAIQAAGYSIYLKVSPETILARLPEHPGRPLLLGTDLPERLHLIEKLLAAREPYYLQADSVIENGGSPDETIGKILKELRGADLL
ncbi:MAG: hypothetical protein A2Z21_00225 [Candidatus Fraserbacteria bacterium RBG_16_55_9]|uniref:Shikimate kinase n=1 Tax=Fraserbacteria sp. (strain RBG_16_55_9) TaxID=1817864 RepID=A0A1F5UPL9_FRAXR|nr:MAG: hypothetical protein A2Z21_00225 [Candidatus Fraserbacteria bacterium RBG_16_55_9]